MPVIGAFTLDLLYADQSVPAHIISPMYAEFG